jgi:hypothetical protein
MDALSGIKKISQLKIDHPARVYVEKRLIQNPRIINYSMHQSFTSG